MANHIWGYWDCPYCGTKGIRGDNKKCTYCGIQIPPNTKFYIKNDMHEQVEQSKLDDRASWICEYCDTQNPAAANYCQNCGSPKDDAKRDYFGNGLNGYTPQPAPQPAAPVVNTQPQGKSLGRRLIPFIVIAVLIAMVAWIMKPVTREATVKGFAWSRSIAIEEFRNVSEDDWTLPNGANLHSTKQEIKSYRQVLDHYETRSRQVAKQVQDGYDTDYRDLGNGQFEEVQTPRYRTEYETEYYEEPVYRNEPVYATKYYYDIDKWVNVDPAETSGSDHSPYWSDTGLGTAVADPKYGDRREGARGEEYVVVVETKKGGEQRMICSFDEWNSLKEGDKIEYKSRRFSDKPIDK